MEDLKRIERSALTKARRAKTPQAVSDLRAEILGKQGAKVILVREETKPEDIHGFFASQGILTSRGGKTSHAAVVARGMGKPCVAGAEGIQVDVAMRVAFVGDQVIKEGDVITIDGSNGQVFRGEVPTVEADFSTSLVKLLGWADARSRLGVRANADTPDDADRAVRYGAKGIGLCRTERMFNAADRLPIVIDMIVAETADQRRAALDRLLPIQRADFAGIFKAMAPYGRVVTLMGTPGDTDETNAYNGNLTIHNVMMLTPMWLGLAEKLRAQARHLRQGLALVAEGKLRVMVDRVFPLDQAAAAHSYLESGQAIGKVVLSI